MDGSAACGYNRSMSPRIEQLREAVEVMHKCKAQHEKSVPVVEMFGDKTVWEGVVESFAITGHPKAKRCYAWSFLARILRENACRTENRSD
jgi:hypothetical protein